MKKTIILSAFLLLTCSTVTSIYIKKDYNKNKKDIIKNIYVIAKEPPHRPELGGLLANIAFDHITLRKNYLVRGYKTAIGDWKHKCGKMDGIVLLTIEKVLPDEGEVYLEIKGELYSCRNYELIWKAEGSDFVMSENYELQSLIKMYEKDYGRAARDYALPFHSLSREILDTLPEPELTGKEIIIKEKMRKRIARSL